MDSGQLPLRKTYYVSTNFCWMKLCLGFVVFLTLHFGKYASNVLVTKANYS